MAEESVAATLTDLPVKRHREEENGVSMETDGNKAPDSISAVIPGWFSEISPMWPGGFFLFLVLVCLVAKKIWGKVIKNL